MLSGLGMSWSEANDMLSGDTVVGGVGLSDAQFDDDDMSGVSVVSVGVLLAKLDSSSSVPRSAIMGAAGMAAIVAGVAVGRGARQNERGGGSVGGSEEECQTRPASAN